MTWLKREINALNEACELNSSLKGEIWMTLLGGTVLGGLGCACIWLSFSL